MLPLEVGARVCSVSSCPVHFPPFPASPLPSWTRADLRLRAGPGPLALSTGYEVQGGPAAAAAVAVQFPLYW